MKLLPVCRKIIAIFYHIIIFSTGTLKKEKNSAEMQPFKVRISPDVQSKVQSCLSKLNITPTKVTMNTDQPVSLLSTHILDDFHPAKPTEAGVVVWSPPQPNWNPWTGCNIDEGPLATASLEQLSEQLLDDMKNNLAHNKSLQNSIADRENLPVFAMKGKIMELINEHPVVIIRGNTIVKLKVL